MSDIDNTTVYDRSRNNHPSNYNAERGTDHSTYINIVIGDHNGNTNNFSIYDGRSLNTCADNELDLFHDVIDGLYKHNPEAFRQFIHEHVTGYSDGFGNIVYRKFGADVSGTDPRDLYTD